MAFDATVVAGCTDWWGKDSALTRAAAPATHFTRSSSQALTAGSDAVLQTPASWTLSFVFQCDSVPDYMNMVAKWGAPHNEFVAFIAPDSSVNIGIDTAGGGGGTDVYASTPAGVATLNTPHVYMAWFDNATKTLSIQIDHGTVYSIVTTGPAHRGSAPFTVGYFPTVNFMNGWIQGVYRWNRAITAGERSDLWNAGAYLPLDQLANQFQSTLAQGLISAWMLDEPSGLRWDMVGGETLSPVAVPGTSVGLVLGAVSSMANQVGATPLTQATALRRPVVVPFDFNYPANLFPAFRHRTAAQRTLTADAVAAGLTGTHPFSVLFVTRYLDAAGNYNLWSAGHASSANGLARLAANGGALVTERKGDGGADKTASGGGQVTANGTACVVLTFDGTKAALYSGGIPIDGGTDLDVGSCTLDEFTVGALRTNATSLFAELDWIECAVYNRAITSAEVSQLATAAGTTYNTPNTPYVPPLTPSSGGVSTDPVWQGEQLLGGGSAAAPVIMFDLFQIVSDFHAATNQRVYAYRLNGPPGALTLQVIYGPYALPNEPVYSIASRTGRFLWIGTRSAAGVSKVYRMDVLDGSLTLAYQNAAIGAVPWRIYWYDDDTVYVLFARGTGPYIIYSTDRGITWHTLTAAFLPGGINSGFAETPAQAYDLTRVGSTLYTTHTAMNLNLPDPPNGNQYWEVSSSGDGGLTWGSFIGTSAKFAKGGRGSISSIGTHIPYVGEAFINFNGGDATVGGVGILPGGNDASDQYILAFSNGFVIYRGNVNTQRSADYGVSYGALATPAPPCGEVLDTIHKGNVRRSDDYAIVNDWGTQNLNITTDYGVTWQAIPVPNWCRLGCFVGGM